MSLSPAHDCPWQATATAQKPMRKVGHLISPTPSPPGLYFGMGAQDHWISNGEETQKFSSEIDRNRNGILLVLKWKDFMDQTNSPKDIKF